MLVKRPYFFMLLISSVLANSIFVGTGYADQPSIGASKPHAVAEQAGEVAYLGNEGLLISQHKTKVLFDPFFHNDYNTYQLVPQSMLDAIFSGKPPYNDIDAIFISHAHGDHFAPEDLLRYLNSFPHTKLIAPQQAIDKITQLTEFELPDKQVIPIKLAYKDPPVSKQLENLSFSAVRIPHAGWPQRAEVSNIVYRVTLEEQITIIHMGDADPDDEHFQPLLGYWNQKSTDTAFPPYWFFTSKSGPMILRDRLQAKQNIGVHVPKKVPTELLESGESFFSTPGETRTIKKATSGLETQ